MDNRAVIERIMRNLAFEVESNSHNEKIKERPNPSTPDPLNVKIKIRKREMNELYNRGFISNNQSEAQVVPQKVRIISSDETIMSFDMFMEADDKIISAKHRKLNLDRRKPGMCLGTRTDEDNQPYMPESHGSPITKSDEEIDIFRKSPNRIERTFLGSKCKPGGCLDPPFDEDIYSYRPSETGHIQQDTNHSYIIDHREKSQTPKKKEIKSVEPVDDETRKTGAIQNVSDMEHIKKAIAHAPKESKVGKYKPVSEPTLTRDSDDVQISDHQDRSINSKLNPYAKSKKKSKDTSFSISPVNDNTDFIKKPIINYPPDDTKKALRTRVSSQEQSRQSISGSVNGFFMPPKGFKRDSNNQAKRDLSKQHFFNPPSVKNKSEEYLRALVEPFPIITSSDHVSVEQSSLSKVIGDIKPNIEKNDKQPSEKKLSSKNTENKSSNPLNVPIQQNKELVDANINDTSSSILISDIKKNAAITIHDKISYTNIDNIDELVTSNNIDNPISLREISKIPVENSIQLEKDLDIYHKTESNINSEKNSNTFDKVETSEDQSSDISKIISRKDKNDMGLPRKDPVEQIIAIENEFKIQNQIYEDEQSLKLNEGKNVSDSINQYLDNNLENMIITKDNHLVSASEQKPKSVSNIIETLENNADKNKHHKNSNFTDDNMMVDDRPLQIANPQDKEIFQQSHKASIVSECKSQTSDLDNMIPDNTTNVDTDRISVLEQKPELENNILETFEESADFKTNDKDRNTVDMLTDENKILDDETLQITKPGTEESFEKQHKDSNISGSICQQFDLDNAIESNIVDKHSDENRTLEDRELPNMDTTDNEIVQKPQVAYSEGLSSPTIEQYHKAGDLEERLVNDIESQVKDFELPASQIFFIKDHASDSLTQQQIIKDKIVHSDKKDKRNEDEISSGRQTQDVITIRPPDDGVVTSDLKTISLNLAFHTYLKNKNETVFETILNDNDISRNPNDSITVVRSLIKVSSKENLPELNIPIDSMFSISIKIKSNDQFQKPKRDYDTVSDKTTIPTPNFSGSGKTLDTIPESIIVKQPVRSQQDQNDTALHRTLIDIYEQELVPLQTMIRSLKTDIDYLAEQRTLLKTKVICSKKSFHRKKISYNISL